MSTVREERHGRVVLLTLARAERRNAISMEMAAEMSAAFRRLELDPAVGAVVIAGEGSAFCAGAELGALESIDRQGLEHIYEAFLCVARSRLPTVAAVGGPAAGAGMNLALCCDIRIVTPRARFITRFLELGIHPGGGHTWLLTRAVGAQRAAAMLLFGEQLVGEEAVSSGLALRCVDDAELLPLCLGLAARAAAFPGELSKRTKQTLVASESLATHEAALELETGAQVWSTEQAFFRESLAAAIGAGSQHRDE